MKLMSEKIPDLDALYTRQLRLLLSAEEMIAIKTPRLIETAQDPELIKVLQEHLEETRTHASRLKEILNRAAEKAEPIKCRVVYALFDEAEDMIEDAAHEGVRQVMLIGESQRIEHYEIAAYGAVRQFARVLGRGEDARLLDQTIREEAAADRQLTSIANRINLTAQKAA